MNGILKGDKLLWGEMEPKNYFTFARAGKKKEEAIKAGKTKEIEILRNFKK